MVGVIHAQNKHRGVFTRENIELLQSMASQLGEILCNNVMYAWFVCWHLNRILNQVLGDRYHSLKHSVDVHVRVAAATQDLLRCDDMKSVLETGVSYHHTLLVARVVMHCTGAFVARAFVGARSARTFLFDKENNVLLCANMFLLHCEIVTLRADSRHPWLIVAD